MKKITRFIPLYMLFAGVACGFLRLDLLQKANDRGLLPMDHPANILLWVLPAAAVALLVLNLFVGNEGDFRIRVSFPVQAVGCLFAGVGYLYRFLTVPAETAVLSVLTLATAVCFLTIAFYRVQAKKPPLVTFAVISLSMMISCFFAYREWGRLTQIHRYLFPALSSLLTALYSLEYGYMEFSERDYRKTFIFNQLALLCSVCCLTTEDLPFGISITLWLASGLFTRPNAMKLPKNVRICMEKLENSGYTVHAVGGCVRDAVLGLTPHDYDLCTNATPEQMCSVFSDYNLVRSGEKHGTIGVVIDDSVYEITTYRTEGEYGDNRHPDHVEFVSNIKDDLARRDFTINAMAYHPKQGYIDPFDGQKDLAAGTLRAVGNAETRFQEDALRILRGVRFACRFGLKPEAETKQAMIRLTPLLENLAKERVLNEMTQILCCMQQQDLIQYRAVILQVIPELSASVRFDQKNPHHKHDVFTHTAYVLGNTEKDPALRWAALLHDAGKMQTFSQDENGVGHFFGHAKVSTQMASDILHRLKASNALREEVEFLILHHMDELTEDKNLLRSKLSKYGASSLKKLIALQKADALACGTEKSASRFDSILEMVETLEKEEGRLQLKDLAVNGHDLMELGFEAGPQLGQCQQYLLEKVLCGEIPNEKEALLQQARQYEESLGGSV